MLKLSLQRRINDIINSNVVERVVQHIWSAPPPPLDFVHIDSGIKIRAPEQNSQTFHRSGRYTPL